jgi:hypothetical protein
MPHSAPAAQWPCLLKNLGVWVGSFCRLTAQGEFESQTPTCIALEGLDDNRLIRQTIQRFSSTTGEVDSSQVLEYRSLSRSVLFFDNGAFSQGSMQFAPFSQFGAEFGFIHGDRRFRLVQLFEPPTPEPTDTRSTLTSVTVIREQREGSEAPERSPLTVDQLVGQWHGEAVTLYADWQSPDEFTTHLSVQVEGDRLQQTLTTEGFQLTSTGQIEQHSISFTSGTYPLQLLLLPDGGSCNTPTLIPKGIPFFLEAGWLTAPDVRQRMIRRYDDKGGWVSLTLVLERKVSDRPSAPSR